MVANKSKISPKKVVPQEEINMEEVLIQSEPLVEVEEIVTVDETVIVEKAPELTIEEPEKGQEVVISEVEAPKPETIEENVKVRLNRDYNGCVGGQWYHLEKDKVHIVPKNLKRIFETEEGLLKPL
jgi:hypothetical protein